MGKYFSWIFIFIFISLSWVSSAHAQKKIIGWLETVTINNSPYPIKAKIDTGADNSSLNAINPHIFRRGLQSWVKFELVTKAGERINLKKPILKKVIVKMKDGNRQSRNVIEIDICIGAIKKKAEVNLVDRSHFKYQILIGRSFLRNNFLVDPAKTYTNEPACL